MEVSPVITALPIMKTERRASAASKTSALAARPKSTPVKPAVGAVVSSVDDDDNQPLRLFKHTPLPTTVDDDNSADDTQPANTASTTRQQRNHHSTDEVDDSADMQSPPSIKLTAADYDTLKSLYSTITATATQLTQSVRAHLTSLPTLPSTAAGNSLYELKNRLLLQYIVRLVHVIRVRVSGASIVHEAAVDDMNEIRVILERIRPIEKRIKYSIDKLLAAPPTAATAASTDPLQYRPNPLDLLPATTSTASTAAVSAPRRRSAGAVSPPASPTSAGVYQAPHHVPTLPTDSRGGRQPRVSAARLRSLYAEVGDRPEERLVEGGGHGEMGEASDEEEERREYEERMMVRLVDTKADKRRKRDREQRKALDNMDEYDELRQFVERRERGDRGGAASEGGRDGSGSGRGTSDRTAGGRSSVDELFNGVERGEGPRKRAKAGGKKSKTGKGTKSRGGGKRR